MQDRQYLQAIAEEAESLRGQDDDESFERRRDLLLELEAHGTSCAELLGLGGAVVAHGCGGGVPRLQPAA